MRTTPLRPWILAALVACAGLVTETWGAGVFQLTEWPAAAPRPTFHLIDSGNRQRSPADFAGRVAVIVFGFTHCPDVCPGELYKLALVARKLGALAPKLQVIFITLDPQRDTSDLLKIYVSNFDERFIGLTGSAAAINAAAESFSISFAKVITGKDYTIEHSTGVYVLDKSGRLRLVGTPATSINDWVHDLRLLLAE